MICLRRRHKSRDIAEAAVRAECSERPVRAHSVSSVFLLRALAAWKMLRQCKIWCCRAAGKPAIHAECSKDQRSNSQIADKADFGKCDTKSAFGSSRSTNGPLCNVESQGSL
jgi:hypothetical protein